MTDGSDIMAPMARGKSGHPPSREDWKQLVGALEEIEDHFQSKTDAAAAIGVSRASVEKWRGEQNYPRTKHLERIRAVLEKVRRSATKVTREATLPVDTQEVAGLAVSFPASHREKLERIGMGALLRAVERGEEPAWMLELELCLLYHRREVESGVVSQTIVAMAREGAFEDEGCAGWDAPRWWTELRGSDDRIRSERRLRRAKRIPTDN